METQERIMLFCALLTVLDASEEKHKVEGSLGGQGQGLTEDLRK